MVKSFKPSEELERQLASLKDAPGVYFFKNSQGEIIYIGKAVNLKARVRSYWNSASWRERPKLYVMMPKVCQVETIVTTSEREALILESTLVRQHMPRYNVTLKDDKRYPWLAITYGESFPRLIMVRDPSKFRKENPKARVFGPYVETGVMWETVRVLRKVFPMRQRKTPLFKDRPCMNYHIGLCLGPCQRLIESEPYESMVKQVEMFLSGRQREVVWQLRHDMEEAAERLDFELAAKLRDRLISLEKMIERQQVMFDDNRVSLDVIGEAHSDRVICVSLLRIREGKLISSESFVLPLLERTQYDEAYCSFVDQYYTSCEDISIPGELILQHKIEDVPALMELLALRSGWPVKLSMPKRGRKLNLMELAVKNAKASLERQLTEDEKNEEKALCILSSLQRELNLAKLPRRIECFDISNTQGSDNVASMVVFENAQAKKSDYRHFKIRSIEGKANDFASMKEAVTRRYTRLLQEEKPLPDLIIIDGGKGQLNAALEALGELNIGSLDVVGLAKQKEEVFLPGKVQSEMLPRRGEALHLLQRVRDEAHRFAVTFHRKLRARRALFSNLDEIPGIGPSRRKALLSHFGSLSGIQEATFDELCATPGISRALAQTIYTSLHRQGESD